SAERIIPHLKHTGRKPDMTETAVWRRYQTGGSLRERDYYKKTQEGKYEKKRTCFITGGDHDPGISGGLRTVRADGYGVAGRGGNAECVSGRRDAGGCRGNRGGGRGGRGI